jgi:surface protein
MYVFRRMYVYFGLSQYFDQCSTAFYSCALTVIAIGAKVFLSASAFNGDLNQWDVAKVTTMKGGKSIRIEENDLT